MNARTLGLVGAAALAAGGIVVATLDGGAEAAAASKASARLDPAKAGECVDVEAVAAKPSQQEHAICTPAGASADAGAAVSAGIAAEAAAACAGNSACLDGKVREAGIRWQGPAYVNDGKASVVTPIAGGPAAVRGGCACVGFADPSKCQVTERDYANKLVTRNGVAGEHLEAPQTWVGAQCVAKVCRETEAREHVGGVGSSVPAACKPPK